MSIESWLVSTITVAPETGRDTYGKPTYGTKTDIAARVQSQSLLVRNARGEESISRNRIYTLTEVALSDRVWLPGTDTSEIEGSNLPIAITISADRPGTRRLYRIDV